MKEALYFAVELIARFHTILMTINDSFEQSFTDKELHFLVIGIIGMLIVFVVHPLFSYLAENGHTLIITWIYVFTLMIVLTFAIEIGQGLTGTGVMEFADIMFGLVGFLAMFAVFAVLRGIVKGILYLIHRFGDKE